MDTDSPTESESESESESTPVPECDVSNPCPPGYSCNGGRCEDDYYNPCASGGYDCDCYGYGYGGDCYEEDPCLSDEECGTAAVCSFEQCRPVGTDLPACDEALEFQPIPNPIEGGELADVISLSFVDIDDDPSDDELVIGTQTGAHVLDLDADEPLRALEGPAMPVVDAASGDFDGDGTADLAIAYEDHVEITYGVAAGPAQPVALAPLAGGAQTVQLVSLRWDGEAEDLLLLDSNGEASLALSHAGQQPSFEPFAGEFPAAYHVLPIDYADGGFDELIVEPLRDGGGDIDSVLVHADGTIEAVGDPSEQRRRAVKLRRADHPDGFVWASAILDWTYVEAYPDGGTPIPRAIYPAYDRTLSADVHGVQRDNLVLANTSSIAVVEMSSNTLNCIAAADVADGVAAVALGDLEGDGSDDAIIVHADGQIRQYAFSFVE